MGLTGAMAVLQGVNAYSQASALESEGNYQRSVADINARFAEMNAEDSIRRGEKDALDLKKQAKRLIGSQRVALAAQGVSLDSGISLDLQEDTAAQSAEDVMTIRNNAWREAWGYRTQAAGYQSQGEFAQLSARNKSRNTLVTGGLQAAQTYSSQNNGKVSK